MGLRHAGWLIVGWVLTGAAGAQDAERGAKLFTATASETGRQVGNCIACHANAEALAQMLKNRGGRTDGARSVQLLLQRAIDGAQPGATNAKLQYRGVLTAKDVQDIGAYIARTRRG